MDVFEQLTERHGGELDTHAGARRWWIDDPDASATADAHAAGLVETRRLFEMRRPLPLDPLPPVPPTRAFDPDADVDAWLAVNNAAFAWHPDQGNWTEDMLRERMAESWFDRDGFRVATDEGGMIGFCWTKVHVGTDPLVGEIYVIAVAPDHAGEGLGTGLTAAGLDWLWTHRRTPVGMLFVEHDNAPALAVYRRLGFAVHSARVAYEAAT